MIPPPGFLGGDLVWWRTAEGWSTRVCIFWSPSPPFNDKLRIEARLFDSFGCVAAAWSRPLAPGEIVLINGATDGPWQAAGKVDGVLALFVCTEGEPSAEARRNYRRLYPYVDWEGPAGEIATLHSDQVMLADDRERVQRITEIAVTESADERNSLVVLSGMLEQPSAALELEFRNASGDVLSAKHVPPMTPFSVNRIELRELAPDLAKFGDGKPLVVSGTFRSRGLYTRPYVLTSGHVSGAYHAGDVYSWAPLPRFAHDLVGGEVNPIAVIEAGDIHTHVHLLHSHGDLDDAVPVDVSLYDADGALVAHRAKGAEARRHGITSFAISDLLQEHRDFTGHVALRFAPDAARAVPRRLQALVEYRGAKSIARVMAWSDEWNSIARLARRRQRPVAPRAFCRVVASRSVDTELPSPTPVITTTRLRPTPNSRCSRVMPSLRRRSAASRPMRRYGLPSRRFLVAA
jgi:hypothetical protein